MSDYVIKEEESVDSRGARYRMRLHPDPDAASPRSQDNLGVLCLSVGRYALPMEDRDVHAAMNGDYGLGGRRSRRAVTRWLQATRGARVVLPVWGYDHGMLAVHAGARSYPFDDRWDSGLAGINFDSADTRRDPGSSARTTSPTSASKGGCARRSSATTPGSRAATSGSWSRRGRRSARAASARAGNWSSPAGASTTTTTPGTRRSR